MTKGRIAHVVGQACRRYHGPDLGEQDGIINVMLPVEHFSHPVAQGTPHTGHLQGMREPVVNKYPPGKGKNLGLVLHAPEGRRKDNPVIIPLKFRPVFTPGPFLIGGLFTQPP